MDNGGTDLTLQKLEQGVAATEGGVAVGLARGQTEVQAGVVMAKNFPRDENLSWVKLEASGRRPSFAEGALYSFPRGGGTVQGPSVKLAREFARCWGNLWYGIDVVSMTEEYVHINGWAWDLESNSRVASEAKFKPLVQRRNRQKGGITEWVKPDERDLREMVNRHGAIAVRNSVLQLLPPHLVDELTDICKKTMRNAATQDVEHDRDRTLRNLASAYSHLGVSIAMLEEKLGHGLSEISPEELTELRQVYTSIRDGVTERQTHFVFQTAKTTGNSVAAEGLAEKLAERKAARDTENTVAEETVAEETEKTAPEETVDSVDTDMPPPEVMSTLLRDQKWEGDLPPIKWLAAVLSMLASDQVIELENSDTRVSAKPHYQRRIAELAAAEGG